MGTKKFLSRAAESDLVQFVAANGENFSMYEHYALERGWQVYTPAYFHRWVWKHAASIGDARTEHQRAVREGSLMKKEARVTALQRQVERLTAIVERGMGEEAEDGSFIGHTLSDYIKAEEQLRKALESLAKEFGEYNRVESDNDERSGVSYEAQMLDFFKKRGLNTRRTTIIENTPEGVRLIEGGE